MSDFEKVFINLNKFINFDLERQRYTRHYETLRDTIFKILRDDFVFNQLFNGFKLAGSYGDNLKINAPDEFDLIFRIKLPEKKHVKITKDHTKPGNVHVDLTEVFRIIEKQTQHTAVYNRLKQCVNAKNFLKVDALQRWLQGCFTKAILALNNRIVVDGKVSQIKYTRQGPAHTMEVQGDCTYSVDFVPGLLMDKSQSVIRLSCNDWECIPKPVKPPNPESTSFRTSYFSEEAERIKSKNNLKNALRILKKFVYSHQNMKNLKSYYIKTLFLWKDMNSASTYWQNPLKVIVVEMFTELEKSLHAGKLQFFWDDKLNMYDDLSSQQMKEMYNCVASSLCTLRKADKDINQIRTYCVFLTTEEKKKVDAISKGYINCNTASNTPTIARLVADAATIPKAEPMPNVLKPNNKIINNNNGTNNATAQKAAKCSKGENATNAKTATPKATPTPNVLKPNNKTNNNNNGTNNATSQKASTCSKGENAANAKTSTAKGTAIPNGQKPKNGNGNNNGTAKNTPKNTVNVPKASTAQPEKSNCNIA